MRGDKPLFLDTVTLWYGDSLCASLWATTMEMSPNQRRTPISLTTSIEVYDIRITKKRSSVKSFLFINEAI